MADNRLATTTNDVAHKMTGPGSPSQDANTNDKIYFECAKSGPSQPDAPF